MNHHKGAAQQWATTRMQHRNRLPVPLTLLQGCSTAMGHHAAAPQWIATRVQHHNGPPQGCSTETGYQFPSHYSKGAAQQWVTML